MMVSKNKENYKFLCRCLAPIEFSDSLLSEDIKNRNLSELIRLADACYLSPALCLGLKRHELFSLLDQEVRDYFEGIHALSVDRSQRLKAQAIDLIKCLNRTNIEPLLLKGVAGLLDGLYEDDGERLMTDIDVLIDVDELFEATKALQESGYRYYEEPSSWRLDMTYKHHAPGLVADGLPASVELHIRPSPLAGKRTLLDSEYARRGARNLEVDGAHALIPSAAFRLLHNFNHSQHQDGRDYHYGRLDVRGLLDWVKLRQSLDPEADWFAMAERVKQFHLQRSFSAYLINARAYFKQPIPQGLILDQSARIHCWRQSILLSSPALARVNNIGLYLFQSGWNLFSPAAIREQYGDVSLSTVMRMHADKVLSSGWRKKKLADIRRHMT